MPGMVFSDAGSGSIVAQHDWWTTSFAVVLALSLFANLCGIAWSIYRELCIRHMSDKLIRVASGAANALSEIKRGLNDLCEKIIDDRGLRTAAKEDIRREIEKTGEHLANMLSMVMQGVQKNGVAITNMNSDGLGQIGENKGETHKHGKV